MGQCMCLGEKLFVKRVKRRLTTKNQRALGNKALLLLMLWTSGGEMKVKRSLRASAQGKIGVKKSGLKDL